MFVIKTNNMCWGGFTFKKMKLVSKVCRFADDYKIIEKRAYIPKTGVCQKSEVEYIDQDVLDALKPDVQFTPVLDVEYESDVMLVLNLGDPGAPWCAVV